MKALHYLQKVGAVPNYVKWDLLMSLVTITNEFFDPETIVEPDIIWWTQEAESHEEFEKRCDVILFATSGDVRALYPRMCEESEEFLMALIEVLLEYRLSLFALSDKPEEEPEGENWFVNNYNSFLGISNKKRFLSKTSILHFYYSDNLVETGQEIMANLAGTEVEFVSKVSKMQAEFTVFASQEGGVVVEGVDFENEKNNPFEGGYQVKMKVRPKDSFEAQECTLHWAPWPTVKTQSTDQKLVELCVKFNKSQTQNWFSKMEEGEEG